ncbi:MAG: haloalkane dehalogenase [Actinomycetota bacterium]
MEYVRTPEDRFQQLEDWPYGARYLDVPAGDGSRATLRMHYIDEGRGPVMVLIHGEPTWSYLYRKMIGPLVEGGFRVLAPDFIGFGRSDKPTRTEDYSYQRHVDWLRAWLLELDLEGVTLFGQDWGGLAGLRLVADHPDRFDRVVVANTGLPTGDHPLTEAFLEWQSYAANAPRFSIDKILQNSTVTHLPPEVLDAYLAPFPSDEYLAGARVFPSLVPTRPDDPAAAANRAAWEVLARWDKPFLTAFSDSDPITAGGERPFQKLVPGARGRRHPTIRDAGHFLQEDKGEELAGLLIDFAA